MSENPYKIDRELKSTIDNYEFEFDPKAKEHFQRLQQANSGGNHVVWNSRWWGLLAGLAVCGLLGISTCYLQDQKPSALTDAEVMTEKKLPQEELLIPPTMKSLTKKEPVKAVEQNKKENVNPQKKSLVTESKQKETKTVVASENEKTTVTKTATTKPEEKPLPIKMETIKDIQTVGKGERIVLNNLLFQAGSPELVESSKPELHRLLTILKDNPKLKIEISGHLCCNVEIRDGDGYDYDNLTWDLSANRAKKVRDFLVARGIDKARLTFLGSGLSNRLVYPEENPEDEAMNRRVEIKITEK